MIQFQTIDGKKNFEIPNDWRELSSDQYVVLISLILLLQKKQITVNILKIRFLCYLMNIKFLDKYKYSREQVRRLNENVFILSEKIDFIFRQNAENQLELNTNFRQNPLPIIKRKFTENSVKRFEMLYGIVFSSSEMLITDLTAEEFIDSYNLYRLYIETQNEVFLNNLISVLYRKFKGHKREPYNAVDCQLYAEKLSDLSFETKYGVLIFFQHILSVFAKLYAVLFEPNEMKPDKINLGLAESVYSLSKKNYGSVQSINNMNVTEFFNLLIKELKDAIFELKAMEKTPTEISDILKLSQQTVESFI